MVRQTQSDYRPSNAAVAASVGIAGDEAGDSIMGWLAVYVPTWGTSVVLDVAITLLAAFMAWKGKADVIYLLTDGEFDKAIIDLVRRLNVGGKVTVHTIGFLYNPEGEVLRAIAGQNGGRHKFVSEHDLESIARR